MLEPQTKKYLFVSLGAHLTMLLFLALGLSFAQPMQVFENTNQHDVISAVVLGESEKSKIITPQSLPTPPEAVKESKPEVTPKKIVEEKPTEGIALHPLVKKKLQPKLDVFGKDLLADIKQQSEKQKTLKQKKLQASFQKTLKQQSEASLRQQLMKEQFKLQSTIARYSQGQVNKYIALIRQSISEHWIIPTQAKKGLYSELMIRVAPGGMVLDVQLTKSSGDPAFDSSARAAVLKASPLPVPSDLKAFEVFRKFILKVKPDEVMAADSK